MPLPVMPARDRTLHRLLARAEEQTHAAGAALWTAGTPAVSCVQVRSGFAILRDAEGRAVDLAGPGELTALEALGESAAHLVSAEALGPVTVVRVEAGAALRALRRAKRTLPLLVDALHAEAERARRVAAGAGGWSAAERLAWVVADLTGRFADAEGWLPAGLPHRILAELAGVHRSTATTRLNAWIWDGTVLQQGRRIRLAERPERPRRSPLPR